ncbi:nucleoside 2-deoxyribosyltransferase [Vagococcus fluvialis]|uniref:nucleoside 2-deoxyribosyltransferase n=1 Tax=Vagococcus fluvialis TaxID=2738 RepID=UPI001D0A8BFC|nr:nucleoside 2-deoxyribosyltransferase [Vagococcus fluvialis]UDM72690.1 nucleoside 2-deoxyribosyltransferase [Vagococcus fluvialis]UDM78413.1 nucleoside 2-deoxyribosyltransferase [Vagococcus fluvialis]UDM83965.1 nucleoside 2-deoxyribosyltransferase [Vagococcus fluvialis]
MNEVGNITVYVGGGMLTAGEQFMREKEKKAISKLGLTPYAPQDDKEINDKQNQTEHTNNGLAERIFDKDTKAMIAADVLVFEISNNNIGTTAEVGQWAMIHRMAKLIDDETINELAKKPIFFHTTDIRDTDIPESGWRRSHSYNQYLIGSVLECNPKGIQSWDEIEQELINLRTKQ